MSPQSKLLQPEYLARLKALQLKARSVVDGALAGLHRSPHYGSSVEFAEHHEYAPGDEIRHIDWRVYAKSDKYYVKRFEQETNLQAMILVDSSSSMNYCSDDATESKWDYACVIAASLAYLLLRQQDSVGLTIADTSVRCYVPPRNKSTHLRHLCDLLVSNPPGKGVQTSLAVGVDHLSEVLTRRGVLYVISDFLDTDERYFRVLQQLATRRQHVHLLQVMDPWELSFPFSETTIFQSLESSRRILAEPQAMRKTYLNQMMSFIGGLRRRCLESGMDYRLMDSSVDIEDALRGFVAGTQQAELSEPVAH